MSHDVRPFVFALLSFAAVAVTRAQAPQLTYETDVILGTDPLNSQQFAKYKFGLLAADVRELRRAKLDAARTAYDNRYKEFLAGRGTLDFLIESDGRLLEAERENARDATEHLAALEKYWLHMKVIEEINQARYDAGRVAIQDLAQSQDYRLEAEIWLLQAREKMKKR